MTDKPLVSLSENSTVRYFTFIALYFSQGIPEGITLFAIPAWMAMNGKSTTEIAGYSAIILIPFSLKILLAPFMEKYTYLPMGRRRPWLLFGQLGILCSLIALSFVPNPLDNIFMLSSVVLCVHVFIMFQDIATDSLVIDIVPLEQQGRANSFMWGSKAIGTSISLFIGSWLINTLGFGSAVLIMSTSVLLIMLVPLCLRERKGEKLMPWSAGQTSPDAALLVVDSWGKLFKSFKQVMILPNTLLLLAGVFVVMAATHFARTLLPIFTIQELGWTNISYSKVFSTASLVGGIVGMIVGAIIIQRYGIKRLLQGTFLLIVLLGTTMALSIPLWKNSDYITTFIVILCCLITFVYIGVLALAMQLCWKRISALQFTFCMTIFNAGLASGAALLGILRPYFNWQMLFVIFSLMIILASLLIERIKTERHAKQLEKLENDYLKTLEADANGFAKKI